jgi:hypothetical protein
MKLEFQRSLVEELRERARMGERPCALAELIGQRLGKKGRDFRIEAIAYFQEAFRLKLTDAKFIGDAPVFEEGRSAEAIDKEMLAILEENRSRWDPKDSAEDKR